MVRRPLGAYSIPDVASSTVPAVSLLAGKVALVTGAGSGLGREYALEFARHGARVLVNDVGATVSGEPSGEYSADAVVREILALGGEAVANYSNVAACRRGGLQP